MKQKTTMVSLALASILAAPIAAQADVTPYATLKVSIDSVNNGDEANTQISSNSSRFGFKGDKTLENGMKAGFQLEYHARVDGESAKSLSPRNSFVSLADGFGTLRIGIHDTLSKIARGKFDAFGDTAADARNIFGHITAADPRAKNAIVYISPSFGGVSVLGEYSTGALDNDDKDATASGAALSYGSDVVDVYVSYESVGLSTDAMGKAIDPDVTTRAVINGKFGATKVGLFYEMEEAKSSKTKNSAMGLNVVQKVGSYALKAQYGILNDSEIDGASQDKTGATNLAIGAFHNYDKDVEIYALYTMTDNADNGTIGVGGGGHDDAVSPTAGKDPSAVSIGTVFKF